jgi:hypothetical protein
MYVYVRVYGINMYINTYNIPYTRTYTYIFTHTHKARYAYLFVQGRGIYCNTQRVAPRSKFVYHACMHTYIHTKPDMYTFLCRRRGIYCNNQRVAARSKLLYVSCMHACIHTKPCTHTFLCRCRGIYCNNQRVTPWPKSAFTIPHTYLECMYECTYVCMHACDNGPKALLPFRTHIWNLCT